MRRNKKDAEQTRQAILDAAEEMFCTQGVAASTLERISCRAGVTRGALYWHFEDKADLLQALYDRSLSAQDVLIRAAAETCRIDPLGLLERAAIEMLTTFEEDVHQQRIILIMNSHPPDGEGTAWLQKVNAELFATLAAVIRQVESRGELTPDFSPEEVAIIMVATMNGLLTQWLQTGKSFPLVDLGARLLKRQMALFRQIPAPDTKTKATCPT